jgi:hypothetical protein
MATCGQAVSAALQVHRCHGAPAPLAYIIPQGVQHQAAGTLIACCPLMSFFTLHSRQCPLFAFTLCAHCEQVGDDGALSMADAAAAAARGNHEPAAQSAALPAVHTEWATPQASATSANSARVACYQPQWAHAETEAALAASSNVMAATPSGSVASAQSLSPARATHSMAHGL